MPVVAAPENVSSTTPPSGHPANMHVLGRSGGNTAKWAPRNGFVVIGQTERLLRPTPFGGNPFRSGHLGTALSSSARRSVYCVRRHLAEIRSSGPVADCRLARRLTAERHGR